MYYLRALKEKVCIDDKASDQHSDDSLGGLAFSIDKESFKDDDIDFIIKEKSEVFKDIKEEVQEKGIVGEKDDEEEEAKEDNCDFIIEIFIKKDDNENDNTASNVAENYSNIGDVEGGFGGSIIGISNSDASIGSNSGVCDSTTDVEKNLIFWLIWGILFITSLFLQVVEYGPIVDTIREEKDNKKICDAKDYVTTSLLRHNVGGVKVDVLSNVVGSSSGDAIVIFGTVYLHSSVDTPVDSRRVIKPSFVFNLPFFTEFGSSKGRAEKTENLRD
ncbi:conserved hypothetical protein [Ricinus communis]|uniref:Uncharacterized protein n=1 Tax=Ricinus communis TaxID=3988 RepID=B9SCE2_RICCO|nr:conserved hypothetical protein [Ricinus communis]